MMLLSWPLSPESAPNGRRLRSCYTAEVIMPSRIATTAPYARKPAETRPASKTAWEAVLQFHQVRMRLALLFVHPPKHQGARWMPNPIRIVHCPSRFLTRSLKRPLLCRPLHLRVDPRHPIPPRAANLHQPNQEPSAACSLLTKLPPRNHAARTRMQVLKLLRHLLH